MISELILVVVLAMDSCKKKIQPDLIQPFLAAQLIL